MTFIIFGMDYAILTSQKYKKQEMMNWDCVTLPVGNLDTGGAMKDWLKIHLAGVVLPDTSVMMYDYDIDNTRGTYFIRHLWSCAWNEKDIPENLKDNSRLVEYLKNDVRNVDGKFFCEVYDNKFLHYRSACNWRHEGMNMHAYLTQRLLEVFDLEHI